MQAQAQSVSQAAAEGGRFWFVELAGAPVADGAALGSVLAEKLALPARGRRGRHRFSERLTFDTLFNGFSIEVDAADRVEAASSAGREGDVPGRDDHRARPSSSAGDAAPDLAAAINMTGANVAQNQLGLTGSGREGRHHRHRHRHRSPGLRRHGRASAATSFPNPRVVAGYDFVGDAYNASGTERARNPVPTPDADPRRLRRPRHARGRHRRRQRRRPEGRRARRRSSAPTACSAATARPTSDIIVAALERAYADGMQVINQSLGAARQWPQYPTAPGLDAPGQQGRGDGRVDRQQRPRRQSARTRCAPRARPASGRR